MEMDAAIDPAAVPELDAVLEPTAAVESAAVEPKKPSILFLVGSLIGGNGLAMGLRMVGGVLQARCVAPSVFGLFSGIGLVLKYAPFLQLGILNGLNRELPYYVGKGDRRRVDELAAAALAWALAIGGAAAMVLTSIAAWYLSQRQWQLAAGWFVNAILAFLLFYNTNYLQMTYRTSHDFARLALAGVIENAVALAAVGLVALFNFYGLCLRALLAAATSVILLYYWRPVRVAPRWNWRDLMHLLIIGAPIFGVGQLYAWWQAIDSTLVLAYMGRRGLGLYGMVLIAAGAYEMVPSAVSQVLYPRMAEQYGRTGRVDQLAWLSIKPMLVSFVGMTAAVVVGWYAVGPATRILVPKYVDAVPAMQWALLAPLASCLCPINNIYNVVRRQDLYAAAMILGMAAYGGCLWWLVHDGASLIAFPQAMLVGRIAFLAACYVLLIPLMHKAPSA